MSLVTRENPDMSVISTAPRPPKSVQTLSRTYPRAGFPESQ